MKRFLMLILLLALPIQVTLPAEIVTEGKTPLIAVAGGTVFENGGHSHFSLQADARVNIKNFIDSQTHKVIGQIYGRAGFVRANGVGLQPELSKQLEGLNGIVMYEYHLSDFFIGVGVGGAIEAEDAMNPTAAVYCGQIGWQPVNTFRFYGGIDYYNRGQKFSNMSAVYLGLALDFGSFFE
jgi:hypothetical protein